MTEGIIDAMERTLHDVHKLHAGELRAVNGHVASTRKDFLDEFERFHVRLNDHIERTTARLANIEIRLGLGKEVDGFEERMAKMEEAVEEIVDLRREVKNLHLLLERLREDTHG